MQTIGSSSLSLGTSIQVISIAAGSPGEQGVKRSSTIIWLLLRDGPRTCRSNKKKTNHNVYVKCTNTRDEDLTSFLSLWFVMSPFWSAWPTGPSWPAAWARPGRWCWCRLRSSRLFCGRAAAGRPRSGCAACCPDGDGTSETGPAPPAEGCISASQICHGTAEMFQSKVTMIITG